MEMMEASVGSSKQSRKAVFLDRDGTLNVEKDYLIEPADFEFIPGVPDALKKLQQAGFLLVIVTNQSGVARGYFSLEQVEKLHDHIRGLLERYGVSIAGIYVCPHHPTAGRGAYLCDCACRKGKPGMLFEAARELNIDLSASFMIGDKLADIQAGVAAGCQTCLVETGYGKDCVRDAEKYGAAIATDLTAVAAKILAQDV